MALLRKILGRWRDFWGGDVDWVADVDSHCWDNKVEIRRRLSSGTC